MSASLFNINLKVNNLISEINDIKAGGATLSGDNVFTGTNEFTISPTAPNPPLISNDTTIATTYFVRALVPSLTGYVQTATNNIYTGFNEFTELTTTAGITDSIGITTTGDISCNTLNYTSLNPPIPAPGLDQVLSTGNDATNSISLNNIGTGSNVISLIPNASANNPTITITDGSTINTIDKNGYTTRNSVQNLTHYLNFSDNSATGTGAIQKTVGISCNPSTNTITATNLVGGLNTSAVSTGIYYPSLVSATSGSNGLNAASGLSYNATSSTLTATTFSGALNGNASTATSATTATNATNATNSAITAVSTNAAYYPTFVSGTTGNLAQSVNSNLSYNPSTAVLTTTTFSGALNGNASTATTATNATNAINCSTTSTTTAGTYYPVFVSSNVTGNYPNLVGVMTYNPSSNTITANTFNGALSGTATNATNTAVTAVSTNAAYYPTFVSATSGNLPQSLNSNLSYNPSTAILTTTGYIGTSLNSNSSSSVSLQANGTTQSSITTSGVQETLLTTQGTATYASSTLTLVTTAAPYPTFYSNIITITGTTNTISTITAPTNMPVNAMYYCYITNSGSGILTINATSLGTGVKSTYTAAVSVPAAGFALGTLTKVGAATYIWSVNLVA